MAEYVPFAGSPARIVTDFRAWPQGGWAFRDIWRVRTAATGRRFVPQASCLHVRYRRRLNVLRVRTAATGGGRFMAWYRRVGPAGTVAGGPQACPGAPGRIW